MAMARTGRPPALRSIDKARLFAEISKTAHRRRGAVYERFSKELKVGISTLQNAMSAMWKAAGVTRTRLRVEPENPYTAGDTHAH